MYKSLSILILRGISLLMVTSFLRSLPIVFGSYISVQQTANSVVMQHFFSMLIYEIIILAFAALLWFGAEKFSCFMISGTSNSQDLNNQALEGLSSAVMVGIGFLIISQSFEPFARFLPSVMGSASFDIGMLVVAILNLILGCLLVLKPSCIWRTIKKIRTA